MTEDPVALLETRWKTAATPDESGHSWLSTEFEAPGDDRDGRWARGERVSVGVRWSNDGAAFELHAEARGPGGTRSLQADLDSKDLGHGFTLELSGHRAVRPNAVVLDPGPQPPRAPDPMKCPFGCQDPAVPGSLWARPVLHRHGPPGTAAPALGWNVYWNAVPFSLEGHFLLVPACRFPETAPLRSAGRDVPATAWAPATRELLPHFPQSLDARFLCDMLAFHTACRSGKTRRGELLLFFNSLHAGGTVPHQHWQLVLMPAARGPLPLGRAETAVAGKWHLLRGYPAHGLVFDAPAARQAELLHCIMRFQEVGVPFNLLLLDGRAFLFPRRRENEVLAAFPAGILASMELAGHFITADRATFTRADWAAVSGALEASTLSDAELVRVLG